MRIILRIVIENNTKNDSILSSYHNFGKDTINKYPNTNFVINRIGDVLKYNAVPNIYGPIISSGKDTHDYFQGNN